MTGAAYGFTRFFIEKLINSKNIDHFSTTQLSKK